jgi:hypothetical protein
MVELILNRLRERDEITETVGASKLVKSWPPALKEWTTKAARDAFFASPSLPRLLKPEAIKRTIADGVNQRLIAYAGKTSGGGYDPLIFEPDTGLVESDIEISDDMVLLRAEDARMHQEPARLTRLEVHPASVRLKPDEGATFSATGFDQHDREMPISGVEWSATSGQIDPQGRFVADAIGDCQVIGRVGDLEGVAKVCVTRDGDPDETVVVKGVGWRGSVPPQKWMNFYTKVLTSLVSMPGLNLEVHFEIPPDESVTDDRIEAIRSALRDLGLSEDLRVTKREG